MAEELLRLISMERELSYPSWALLYLVLLEFSVKVEGRLLVRSL